MWHKQLEDVNLMALCHPRSPEQVTASRFVLQSSQSTTTVFHPAHTHTYVLKHTHTWFYLQFPKQDFHCHRERDSLTVIFALSPHPDVEKRKRVTWCRKKSRSAYTTACRIFFTKQKRHLETHTHTHPKTFQDAVKYTLPTSANQHLRGQMVTGCILSYLSYLKLFQEVMSLRAADQLIPSRSLPHCCETLFGLFEQDRRWPAVCARCMQHNIVQVSFSNTDVVFKQVKLTSSILLKVREATGGLDYIRSCMSAGLATSCASVPTFSVFSIILESCFLLRRTQSQVHASRAARELPCCLKEQV